MAYYDLSVTVDAVHLDAVTEYAASLSSSGLYIEDLSDLKHDLERSSGYDYIDENLLSNITDKAVIHIYPTDRADAGKLIDGFKRFGEENGISADISLEEREEEHWETSWQQRYDRVCAGKFEVIPYWKDLEDPDLIPLRIDTAEAYGSGQSVNTQLCLEALSDLELDGARVLDMGTGTGILGIASLLAGAEYVTALDIDPFSIDNSCENAAANGVGDRFSAFLRTKQSESRLEKGYDAVFAHITADVIIEDRELYYQILRVGGALLCGGIVRERKDETVSALRKTGFGKFQFYERDEWVTLLCRKEEK